MILGRVSVRPALVPGSEPASANRTPVQSAIAGAPLTCLWALVHSMVTQASADLSGRDRKKP